jgi:hypothetical protein
VNFSTAGVIRKVVLEVVRGDHMVKGRPVHKAIGITSLSRKRVKTPFGREG